MAKNNLTRAEIGAFIEGLGHYFPYELGFSTQKTNVDGEWSDLSGIYKWLGRDDFFTKLSEIVDVRNGSAAEIKKASNALEAMGKTAPEAPEFKGAKPQAPRATPSREELAEMQRRAEEAKKTLKATTKNAEDIVNAGIERQKEIYEQQKQVAELTKKKFEEKDAKVWVKAKVQDKEKPVLTGQQEEQIQRLATEINKDPVRAIGVISTEIQHRIKDIPEAAAKLTATEIVYGLATNNMPQVQRAVLEAEIKQGPEEFVSWASPLADQGKNMHELARAVTATAFPGLEKVALPELEVEIFDTPEPETTPIPLVFIPIKSMELIEKEESVLKNPSADKPEFMKTFVEKELEKAKTGIQGGQVSYSGLIQGLSRPEVPTGIITKREVPQIELPVYISETQLRESVIIESFTVFTPLPRPATYIDTINTQLPLALGISQPLSIISGVAQVGVQAGVQKVTTKVAAAVVAKTGLKAVVSKVVAFFGGPVGAALAWIGTEVIGKVWSKIKDLVSPKKLKEAAGVIIGAPILIAGFLLHMPALTFAGASSITYSVAAMSGVTVASVGGGIVKFFGAVASATLGAIGGPILAILLGFPVVVALILFIINSGAYVVPPEPASFAGGGLGGANCTTQQTPTGINYSVNSVIATRALGIMEDMYEGFWCYWNRSPGDLPTDVINHPPAYPELFDYPRFLAQPFPSEAAISNCADCMFWCTTLVQKAYAKGGINIQNTLWAPTMYEDFNSRKKFLSNNLLKYPSTLPTSPTPGNIVPGSVVFFQVLSGDFSNVINHVGIVYKVDSNGLTFLQSNAGMKTGTLSYSGGKWTYVSGIAVVGFGLP